MKIKKLLYTGFLIWAGHVHSQSFTAMRDTATFNTRVRKMGNTTQTLESDFTQVKSLKMLKDKVSSKGKLYFKKNNKVRWEYTSPFAYIVVINDKKASIKNEGKITKYDLTKNKVFSEMNDIIVSCVQGTILASNKFQVSYFESSSGYKIDIFPKNENVKKTLKKISLYFDLNVTAVKKMEMFEPSGDFTSIDFSAVKVNKTVPDAIFVLK